MPDIPETDVRRIGREERRGAAPRHAMKLGWPASVVQVVVPAGLLLAIGEGLRLVLSNDASGLGLSPAAVAVELVLCGTAIAAVLGVCGAKLLTVALPEGAPTRRLWLVRGASH